MDSQFEKLSGTSLDSGFELLASPSPSLDSEFELLASLSLGSKFEN